MTDSAALRRAVASLRARPGSTLTAAVGLLLIGLMLGTAVTTGWAVSTGFDRAQDAAGTADLVTRFDTAEAATVRERLTALPNVRRVALRRVLRPVALRARTADGTVRSGTAEVNGLDPVDGARGLAVVAGRPLGPRGGEAVVERGLADAWALEPGDRVELRGRAGVFEAEIVGVAVEPDNVAFPLAARPRVYVGAGDARALAGDDGRRLVDAAYVEVADPDRLPETLVQARVTAYGVTGLSYTTRTGVRALVDQAGGLVVALLAAFAAITLAVAAATLAATGHARVSRDLPTIGALRAIGFTPRGLAWSYAAEAMLVAVPALAIGIALGAVLVSAPTARLLVALNELPPPHALGLPHLAALLVGTAVAGIAAGRPAGAAGRRPIVETLDGAVVLRPRRTAGTGRPVVLGARLAVARPGRLAVTVVALAAAVATVFLLLALGRFLLAAERDPSTIGERYSLVVPGRPGALERVRATPGVAAAAERYEARGVDVFDLREPLTLVAFGSGGAEVFAGRALLEGRRVAADDEAEVGRGIARTLGLEVGGTLLVQLAGGGEARFRVVGVVQELADDGRVVYTRPRALVAGVPGLDPDVVVRPDGGTSAAELARRLRLRGLTAEETGGLVPSDSSFLATVVAVLRVVAVTDGLVCAGIVLLALGALARERAGTLAVLRTVGAGGRALASTLAGAALAHVVPAVALAYALERLVLAPALSSLVARYGTLPLAPSGTDVAIVAVAATLVALATGGVTAARTTRRPVASGLREA